MRLLLIACLVLCTSGCANPKLALRQVFHSAEDDRAAARAIASADKDHDGALSRDEYVAVNTGVLGGVVANLEMEQGLIAQRLRQHPNPQDRQELIKRQQKLPLRLKSARDQRAAALPRAEAQFKRYDFNGDGRISARELAAANDEPANAPIEAP